MTKYTAQESQEPEYTPLAPGNYRVRVADVEAKVAQSGNKMYKFTFDVSGSNSKLFYHFVFVNKVQKKINQMNNCFGMPSDTTEYDDDVAPVFLKGKIGGVEVEHTEYEGKTQASVKWLLWRSEVDKLPAWSEGAQQPANTTAGGDIDDSIPF